MPKINPSLRIEPWKILAFIGLWLATAACSQAGAAAKVSSTVASDTDSLIHVNVYGLAVDPASQQPVVTLVDSDEKRAFPIWIGLSEARANGSLEDEHTGLYQRPGFIALAQQQLRVAHRTKTELSFLIVDRNGVKSNDGGSEHREGDRRLTELGAIVGHTFRESDIVGRLNGKDYGVLLVGTSEQGTNIAVSRLRENVKAHNADGGDSRRLSVNVGVAHYDPGHPPSLDDLVTRAGS